MKPQQSCGPPQNHPKPSRTTQNHPEPPRTIQNHSEPGCWCRPAVSSTFIIQHLWRDEELITIMLLTLLPPADGAR